MKVELWFLFSACRLMMVYIWTKFHENILDGIKVTERTGFSWGKFQRGIVGGVTVLVLCTSFDDGLYLYKVS